MPGRNELVERWIAMWNETDNDARRKAVDDLFAPRAVYSFFNLEPFVGRDAIYKQVTVANRIYIPRGFQFLSQHNARGHHNLVRFSWVMVSATTGEVDMLGNDVLVLDDEGRIEADYQFHDLLSSVAYHELPYIDELVPDLELEPDERAMYRAVFDRFRSTPPPRV